MPGTQRRKNPCGYLFAKYRFKRKWHDGECWLQRVRESSNVQCTHSHLCSSEHPHIIQDDRTSIFTGLNPLNQLLAENLKYVFVHSVCSSRLGVCTFLFAVLCVRLKWMRVSCCCCRSYRTSPSISLASRSPSESSQLHWIYINFQ